MEESGDIYDLGPNHTNSEPHVRRLKALVDRDPIFWDFARSILADIAADLVGPDVKFHSSKLNYKWPGWRVSKVASRYSGLASYKL